MKHTAVKFIAIFCLLAFVNPLWGQQSKVDSAILFLNKSFATKKLDTASFGKAASSLTGVVLSDKQIEKIEEALKSYKNWENNDTLQEIRFIVMSSLGNSDADKAIKYGQMQIDQLEKLNTQTALDLKIRYLSSLRFPFRNSNRLEEGFKYYTSKLNQYKTSNDSLCIQECHFVLSGFYRISGLLDLAIYHLKKSLSLIDSIKYKKIWINNTGVLGYYYYLKENPIECLKYNRIANNFYLKDRTGFAVTSLNMASAMLLNNQLDSAAYFITLAKSDPIANSPDRSVAILQTEAKYKIQLGAFAEADSLLQKCWQVINEKNIPVNAGAGIIAPDFYLAQLRIKQNRFQEAINLLFKDIGRLLNNRYLS